MRMYFIALLLPDDLNRQVLALKQYMRDHYGCRVALRSPAHITIIPPFWMDETMQENLEVKLDQAASEQSPFFVRHDGFSSFPPKTIFVAAKPNAYLDRLHRNITAFFRSLPEFPMKFDDRAFHPHVTIATRDLTKKTYHEAWEHFKQKRFEKEWRCSSICLLGLFETGWEMLHASDFIQA